MGVPSATTRQTRGFEALGDALDDTALSGGIPTLEQDADLQAPKTHPLLHLQQFELQAHELVDVFVLLGSDHRRLGIAEYLPTPFQKRLFLGIAA